MKSNSRDSLDLYRRHAPDCKYADKGQNYTKCSCPIWCYGKLVGRPVRQTLRTRDWTLALRKVSEMLAEGSLDAGGVAEVVTVRRAVGEYIKDCQARDLADSTLRSYGNVLKAFAEFCDNRNIRDIKGLALEDFRHFRAGRKVSNKTQRKEIETLRAFCAFCDKSHWIKENFAANITKLQHPTISKVNLTRSCITKLTGLLRLNHMKTTMKWQTTQVFHSHIEKTTACGFSWTCFMIFITKRQSQIL